MKASIKFCVSLTILMLLAWLSPDLFAVEPMPEVIDKTNWEKAEGLVPDCLLEWVKKGEITLPLGQLNYDTAEYFPPYAIESFTTNVGKYELNEEDIIVDVETGEMAKTIVGFPFPKVDPDDPKAAIKIIYNKQYVTYVIGFKKFSTFVWWLGRNSGFEREIEVLFQDAYLTGFPGAREYKNPKDVERYALISVKAPYDLAGTAQLMWRYLSAKADMNFAYVPAIRRVRRMSPANRSDGFVGSDFAVDDILAYDGKIPLFEWELVEKKEALVPFGGPDPLRVDITEKGEWDTSGNSASIRYGFQDKEWQGAPWAPLDPIYVKRPVWVIKGKSKDPYYNYGTQYIWIFADSWGPAYKTVYDRGEKFWKFLSATTAGYKSDDGSVKFLSWLDHLIVDTRRDHATIISQLHPDTILLFNAILDLNDFSLAGFQKFCK
jgi:hypothetical protein